MGKQGLAFVNGAFGCRCGPVLPRPRVEALKQETVNVEEIGVRQVFQAAKIGHCVWQVRTEQFVFSDLHDVEVFFALEVAQITSRLKVFKRIEHGAFLPAGD